MLVAKVQSDRARNDLAQSTKGHQKPRETFRKKDKLAAKDAPPNGHDQVEAFRASRAAALAFARDPHHISSGLISEATWKRSSVVAMVTKRVELLHMNTICREFTQVLVSWFYERTRGCRVAILWYHQ